ncbi:hypothetical protein FRC03_009747 [Tulasnella sp. 419]|nr:hypothetical protein FRC03_009747 [Tulasnella sp. 419]
MAAILQRSQTYAFQHKDTRSVSSKFHAGFEQQQPPLDASSRSKSALFPLRERKALTPIYPNTRPLRRLPSRMTSVVRHLSRGRSKVGEELEKDQVYLVTRKRKRGLASGNENVANSSHGTGVSSGGSGSRASLKRQRSLADPSSSRTETSRMDVDDGSQGGSLSPVSDEEDEAGSSDDQMEATNQMDESDEFNLYDAPQWQLQKLRKDHLLHLYSLAELALADEAAEMTKADLINGILDARQSRPANSQTSASSSHTQRRSNGASPSSSHTDGNDGGAEDSGSETGSVRKRARLRRRATDQTITAGTSRNGLSKSKSMGFIQTTSGINRNNSLDRRARIAPDVKSPAKGLQRRQRSVQSSYRSSPSSPAGTDGSAPPVYSPRHTRSRVEKGKNRHVEFSEADGEETDEERELVEPEDAWVDCDVRTRTSSSSRQHLARNHTARGLRKAGAEKLSAHFSPRKLRARPTRTASISSTISSKDTQPQPLRRQRSRPQLARKAKAGGNLKEEGSSEEVDKDSASQVEELDELEDEDEVAEESDHQMDELAEDDEEAEEVDEVEEEESRPTRTRRSRSRTASSSGQVPTRQRLRAARSLRAESPLADENQDEDEDAEENEDAEEEDEVVEDEPRVLRNGKVVGELVEDDDDDVVEEIEEAEEDELQEDGEEEDQDEMEDAMEEVEVEDDGEESSEDIDLSEATAKSLVRLRRDDLVRLCETRDLDAEGTKNQLVHNLLEWRNQHATPPSSTQASSRASTVRAPSTPRPGRNGSPVLLRSDRIHVTQPKTPDPEHPSRSAKHDSRNKDGDELDIDLESLGLEDHEIPADKLLKLEKIGSGGFKDVYIGKFRGRKVAIAEFRGTLSSMDIKELKLLRDFHHENIVRFLGVCIPENTRDTPVMMVSELCTNGDLFDYIRNVPPPTLRKVLNLMSNIAHGLRYLHTRQPSIIHRDCKSSNILITSKVTAKIADFGLAKVKQSTRSMVKSLVGTVNWQAPELWHAHPKYDHKVDVFSCAMVFWEMLQWHVPHKKYPWEGMNEHAIYEEVGAKKHRPSIAGLRKQWCPEIVDLIERMWAQDPKERPTMSQVYDELQAILALKA